jgi:hypothetical protein
MQHKRYLTFASQEVLLQTILLIIFVIEQRVLTFTLADVLRYSVDLIQ